MARMARIKTAGSAVVSIREIREIRGSSFGCGVSRAVVSRLPLKNHGALFVAAFWLRLR
jgi:hypothetical protein